MTDILGPTNAANATTARPADSRAGSFGSTDTWMKDCTTSTSGDGTLLTSAMLNAIIANMRALVRGNGNLISGSPVVAENNTDTMLLTAVQQLIQRGQLGFAQDIGAVNALVINPNPALLELKAGVDFWVLPSHTNTNATVTINVSSLGAVPVKRIGGAALRIGDIQVGGALLLFYDGTQFQIVSMIAPLAGASTQAQAKVPGVSANQLGAASTAILSSVGTIVSFGTTILNNCQTSTWNGSSFTVGAGEAGLYGIVATAHLPQGSAYYCGMAIYVNGAQVGPGVTTQATAGTAQDIAGVALPKLNVGDVVTAVAYQQSGGAISTVADATTTFAAFLLSAY